ncbi:MAG: hypothetical protein JNK47_20090 [Mesorhizobium sp.]|nr:hypothetical protein [Mesorhizobium sp.]MBL8579511.1 hypothetical protein [Mesorhizobium sp.]
MNIDTSKALRLDSKPPDWGTVTKAAALAAIVFAVAAGNYAFGNIIAASLSLFLAAFVTFIIPTLVSHVRNGTKVTIELTPTGMTLSSLKYGEIPWSVIRHAETWRKRKMDSVLLRVSDEYLYNMRTTFLEKATGVGNKLISADGILIPHRPFGRDVDELRDLINAYARSYSERKSGI